MPDRDNSAADLPRRHWLQGAAATLLVGACSGVHAAMPAAAGPVLEVAPLHREEALDWKQVLLAGDRTITLRRDGPSVALRYGLRDGTLDVDGYRKACYLLRDVRAGRMAQIDPQLLDVLCGIQRWMDFNGRSSTIEITSGYRTAETNDSAEGSGKHSMHLVGKAADIVVPGATSAMIGAMVQRFNHDGGTGIYLGKGFVHVDTGAARTWVMPAPPRRRRLRRR